MQYPWGVSYIMNKRSKTIFISILAAIAIIITIGIIVNINRTEKTESPEPPHKIMHVYMPDVVGQMEESAYNKLSEIGFYNIKIEYVKTGLSEAGRVNRQSIPPQTTAGTDFEITLYIESK
jgi:PASTA domain.